MKNNIYNKIWSIVDVVIWLLLSFFSIIQVIPLIATSSDFLKHLYWFLIIMGVFLLLVYSIYKIYNTFYKNNWIQCENFPNDERICLKVRELINDDNFIQETKKKSFDCITNEDNLYQQFLNVILKFFILSRKNCIMTLPYNPYVQIKNEKNYSALENSLDSISKTIISQKDKIKVITLSNEDLEKFKLDLIQDYKVNSLKGLKIKKYLDSHKKKINLFWLVNPSKAIDEFIIIDESVDISVSENDRRIQVDFHKETIEKHKNDFDIISTSKKTTVEFFNKYIQEESYLSKFDFKNDEEKKFISVFK